MPEFFANYDRAVHSDFLLHWTGKDIDVADDPRWYEKPSSRTADHITEQYLERLRNILRFGLWMTSEPASPFRVGGREIVIPSTPRCCFTELRLSEARRHAALYGRLAIGVKRPFLFERSGRPLAYFGYGGNAIHDKFFQACSEDLKDQRYLNFFKPMNTNEKNLIYELYAESEWRLLFFDELLRKRKIVDPRDPNNLAEHEFFKSLPVTQQQKLQYLVPLDGWFCFLVYPSLDVKNRAQWNLTDGIRREIERIKTNHDHANQTEGIAETPPGNWPVEIDLDACRHL